MNDLDRKISSNKLMIFSIPHLEIMLKKKYTNCVNFEHTIFLTEPYLKYFLDLYGFEVLEKKFFKKDHSIFYACKKLTNKKKTSLKSRYSQYKKMYNDYIFYHLKLIKKLNKLITNKKTNNPVFLFGARVISFALVLKKKIMFILGNDKQKQNKRLYGTNLNVRSPKILSEMRKTDSYFKSRSIKF